MNVYKICIEEQAEQAGIKQKGILSFRPFGQKIRRSIEDLIHSIPSGSVINLDFSGIKFSDSSCADEVVLQVQLFLREKSNNIILYVSNINDSIKEELEAAIALQEKSKGRIPFLYCKEDGSFQFIGEIEDKLDEAFQLLREKKSLTTRDVMQSFDIAVNSASNRLKKLWDYGLALREEQIDHNGKQHIYSLP
ncbi:hypothetical protein JCM15765_14570 [Paradesulfitobacterium aromaticivorans]